ISPLSPTLSSGSGVPLATGVREVLLSSSSRLTGSSRVVSMKNTSKINTTSISGVIRIGNGRGGRGSTSCIGKAAVVFTDDRVLVATAGVCCHLGIRPDCRLRRSGPCGQDGDEGAVDG